MKIVSSAVLILAVSASWANEAGHGAIEMVESTPATPKYLPNAIKTRQEHLVYEIDLEVKKIQEQIDVYEKNKEKVLARKVARLAKKDKRCGEEGSVEQRVKNCAEFIEVKFKTDDEQKAKWRLVTRTVEGKEVWLDTNTGLIWGDVRADTAKTMNCDSGAPENGKNISGSWRLPTPIELEDANEHYFTKVLPNAGVGEVGVFATEEQGKKKASHFIICVLKR